MLYIYTWGASQLHLQLNENMEFSRHNLGRRISSISYKFLKQNNLFDFIKFQQYKLYSFIKSGNN